MASTLTQSEEAQLGQTIEMFEVITESQPHDYQSLEILKEAYSKLGREKDVVRTAKRIAEAYVDMGQLSSAILEYETILQRCPDDPDVQKALKSIESKASNFSEPEAPEVPVEAEPPKATPAPAAPNAPKTAKAPERNGNPSEEGRQNLVKILVESKIITMADFDMCWDIYAGSEGKPVVEPFVQVLADRGVIPVEKSLKIISDKSRTAFLPLEKYEMDIELARTFPADVCRRWCVVPFDRMSKSVLVATANPFNQEAAKQLSAATPHRLLWYLATPIELVKILQKTFR
jgi:hypothetical protein